MTFFLLDLLSFFLSLLGFRGLRAFAYLLGFLAFDIMRIRRKIVLGNLDIVFGSKISNKKKRQIGRKSVINFISTALEFVAAKRLLPKAKFEFENKNHADHVIFQSQLGIYAICMHLGNWEYFCHINAKQYSPVNVVVKDVLSGKAEQWIKKLRYELGYKLLDRVGKLTAAQQIFNAIDNKEIVGFIVDQKRSKGQMLPFFGRLTPTNDGLAKLYFRKPAIIFSGTITRLKPGHFRIKYFDPFIYKKDPNLSLNENIQKFTLQVNQFLEPIILSNPEEYHWLHNRWKLKK